METRSTCPYCGVGCGVVVEHDARRITGVRGDPDHPANFGQLCTKGRTLHLTAAPQALAARRVAKRLADEAGAAFHRGDFPAALEGFRGALAKAPDAPDADQTRLMVAVILARKLPDAAAARAALAAVGTALPANLEPLRTALRQELGA